MDLTICVPTFRRVAFVRRLLRYYDLAGFRGQLRIGDASSDEDVAEVLAAIAEHPSLRVVHHHWPGLCVPPTLDRLARAVDTTYATFCGDDDALVPAGLEACVARLQAAPAGTVGAIGDALFYDLAGGAPRLTSAYRTAASEEDRALDRLSTWLHAYWVPLFAVIRADAWRRMWRPAAETPDLAIGAELLPSSVGIMLGKFVQLPVPYLIRQAHDAHTEVPRLVDWVTAPAFAASFADLEHQVVELARELDDAAPEQARAVLRASFDRYIARCQVAPPPAGRLRRAARALRRRGQRRRLVAAASSAAWRAALAPLHQATAT